ncbi:HD domain-containing protein [Candidatus Micrarchaeota archaeon]|nr:HD domain-containing protein [Candidatus Micrarchaeota archaeon]
MSSLDYRNHARAKPVQALVYRSVSRSEPALEGITRGFVVKEMLKERDVVVPGVSSLVKCAARRLNEREGGKDKWRYTRRHCVEVGFLSYLIAKEAKERGAHEARNLDPELCFIGGVLHDIGKTFLPMSLVVKELGVNFLFFRFFQGARMSEVERRILRDEHLSAGTRYVRLFGGNGQIKTILDMVGLHHVMYNGLDSVVPTYPKLFKGRDLPLHARIAKTADFLSAVLPRHYRQDSWVLSFRTAIAYAATVAGRELDPLAVRYFLTGTHDMEPEQADSLVASMHHPKGQRGISDYDLMKAHIGDTMQNHGVFKESLSLWNLGRIEMYEDETEKICNKSGFPPLHEVSPLSIKNKYAHA